MTEFPLQGTVIANGLEFAYLEAGEGPLALCLHGFPDSAWTWRAMLAALAHSGYRAIAPWMRGYAPTAVPHDQRYDMEALASDAVALHEAFGGDERAVLIGHDWGAFTAYAAADLAPMRWRRLVTSSVPPPGLAGRTLRNYDQVRRAWHLFFFQSPFAESVITANGFSFIERLWQDWSPGFDPGENVLRAKDALRGDGRASAALGYYRALFAGRPETRKPPPVATLYIHGEQDGAMSWELPENPTAYLGPGSRHVVVSNVGHFPHLERPDIVIGEVLRFLATD
jgi:pimeloyl-ACP methyl ester carboxylesterase